MKSLRRKLGKEYNLQQHKEKINMQELTYQRSETFTMKPRVLWKKVKGKYWKMEGYTLLLDRQNKCSKNEHASKIDVWM